MGRFARYLRWPAEKRRLFRRALATMALVRAGLWLLPFRTLQKMLAGTRAPATQPATPEEIAWATATAARFVPRATCLVQALAAQRLCLRAGHPACLRIGVRRDESSPFAAHAWLEVDGRVLVGAAEQEQFTPLLAASQEPR